MSGHSSDEGEEDALRGGDDDDDGRRSERSQDDALGDEMDGVMDDLEFSADSVLRNDMQWLEYPKDFIQPAKMCSVNKFVQCVDKTFMQHSIHHVPTGPEYVLVGHDSPSLPAHMFNWIWAITQINLMQHYCNCVVPVGNFTRVNYVRKGKELVATNLKRRLVVSKGWSMDAALQTDVWFADMPAQKSMMAEAIDEMRKHDTHYADVNAIQLLWNIIPLSYINEKGQEVRQIVHVLKTIPAPGFDLMRCLVNLGGKRDQKLRNGVAVASVLQTITEVFNYECNRNLKISGCFGRSHPLPHPMEVLEDPESPMNPGIVLSPFLVMRKIVLQLPVTKLRDLIIDGFPLTSTLEERTACFAHWITAQTRYKRVHTRWHIAMGAALSKADKTGVPETRLPPVLINSDEECLDQIYCNMTMAFNLKKWLEGGAVTLDKAEMLRLPQLAVATITPFQYSDICGDSVDEFIKAHLGDQNNIVDETELHLRYSQDNGSWGDMPHGAMYKSARESFKTSIKTMQADPCMLKRIKMYQNYLRAQSTIHSQAVLVDLMMSDRVLHCAQCLNRLESRIGGGMANAFSVQMTGVEAARQRVIFEAYPDSVYYMRILHILSVNNRYIRANAVNLTTLFSFLVSDVLTHLGSHHETWNWMMYTVQVMGGAGHLRAMTDDHSNKTPVIFTSKPNSVGFNAVITKMFKALATMVLELLPDLTSDFLEPLRFMKLDRTTRAGVEGVSSVMFINGVKESAPSRKTFMRPIIMDEGYRSMDAAALNGFVCSIPRDSDGGSGNILKSIDPGKAGGAHLQGHQRQLPGLSPFLVGMTSNSNPHTPVIGECIKTFSVVTAMFPSGAQVGGQLSQITSLRKRKLNDFHSCNTNAASTLPSEKHEREQLAWSMSVLFMAARQLALVNKTAQVDFEINIVCRQFAEWLRNIIYMHFLPFFGSNLCLSYDRVIAGFMTRQIATTFTATCARHLCESANSAEANTKILQDMEVAPLTVQSTNVALCNALTHLVDTNLIMVNQFIRDRICTPVIPLDLLMDVFGTTPIGMGTPVFDELFAWLGQMVRYRQGGEMEYSTGYITVAKLGTLEDYQQKEAYLESYFGIAKNNFYTYVTAIKECATKSFDLSGFLCSDGSMLDFHRFVSRLGVGNDIFSVDEQPNGAQPAAQAPVVFDTYRNTYLFTQSNAEPAAAPGNNQAPAAPSRGMGRCWVSLIQHLFITAIQGRQELHADNMFTFGSNMTEFILSRCSPIQSTPAQCVLYESFRHIDNEVVPLRMSSGKRPPYFVRSINDTGALANGLGTELPPLVGAHPLEDVMHLGSWIQLYSILHSGARPTRFETFPLYNGRPPELVRGRTYPLLGLQDSDFVKGTISLYPGGRCVALMTYTTGDSGDWHNEMLLLDCWFNGVCAKGFMVAPLVNRHHAVFRDPGRQCVWLSSCEHTELQSFPEMINYQLIEDGLVLPPDNMHFLDDKGRYTLVRNANEMQRVDFMDAHDRLVPLGTFLLVDGNALGANGLGCERQWIRCSLRYPDEGMVGSEVDPYKVYFTVIVRDRNTTTVRIISAEPRYCLILDEHGQDISMSIVSVEATAVAVVNAPPVPEAPEAAPEDDE